MSKIITKQLSKDASIGEILSCKAGQDVFDKFLPGMRASVEKQTNMRDISFEKLVGYSRGAIPETIIPMVDEALRQITIEIEEAEKVVYSDETPLSEAARVIIKPERPLEAVYTGKVWRDTEGKRIQAHGGAVYTADYDKTGYYYWYGENKDHTDGKCHVWTWGIRAYRSRDLYNWEDMGLIIPPVFDDETNGMYPECHADRPHILKCPATGKYVCWIKQSGQEGCFLILQADSFFGPYEQVMSNYRPEGLEVGDFDMIIAENGKGYMFMDGSHGGVYGYLLAEDFLSAQKRISEQYTGLHAPFCREAITLFERKGRIYMLTSGMSGYIPNRSDSAMTDSWDKPFVSTGDPHVDDTSKASFNSQISQVFNIPGTDRYISVADRWVPEFVVTGEKAEAIERFIANHFEPDKYPVQPGDQEIYMSGSDLESANTSIADYVWLPVEFDENDLPKIRWQDEWR